MYLFDEIDMYSNKGSGDLIKKIYPENFVSWFNIIYDKEFLKIWEEMAHLNIVNFKNGSSKLHLSNKKIIRNGESLDIYLPLVANFWKFQAINMNFIRAPIRLRFLCSNDVVVSGSVSNLSLTDISLIIKSPVEQEFDVIERNKLSSKDNKYIFLDYERLTFNNYTLTASTKARFPLDQLVGKVPFLHFMIKSNTAPITSDYSKWSPLDMGDNVKFDLENASGQSLFGNGNSVKSIILNSAFVEETGNYYPQGHYFLNFSDSLKRSYGGNICGYHAFNGQKDYLCIDLPSAATAEVHTITLSGTSASGVYRFEVNGEYSPFIAYNASVGTMKSTLEAMEVIKSRGYTITASATVSAGTSLTITFNVKNGRVNTEIGTINIEPATLATSAPAAVYADTAITTYGSKGFATGSAYQVEIYAPKFRNLIVSTKGELTASDL